MPVNEAWMKNHWNEADCSNRLELSNSNLTVSHKAEKGCGSVRSELPINKNVRRGIFYFEVKVVEAGGRISIGLCEQETGLNRYIDHCTGAYALTNGGSLLGSGLHRDFYTSAYGQGDVVGCGLKLAKQELFFTVNGQRLDNPISLSSMDSDLFPLVSTDRPGDTLETNFGLKPFAYENIWKEH